METQEKGKETKGRSTEEGRKYMQEDAGRKGEVCDTEVWKSSCRKTALIFLFVVFSFDEHFKTFKQTFGWYKGLSVSGLWIEIICNFTMPSQVLSVREAALSAICAICQGYPQQFLREDVTNAFELALKDRHHDLEVVLLSSFKP